MAYCLQTSVLSMAAELKSWYNDTYQHCREQECKKFIENRRNTNIKPCIDCWVDEIIKDKVAENFNVTAEKAVRCVEKYIPSSLSDELPNLVRARRDNYKILLPKLRPAEFWWSVTVRLPCKPRRFMFFNAYCINSFANNLREGDYALVKNNFVEAGDITFYVEFSDACTFGPNQITILWDESVPSQALPQISSFPSKYPPKRNEKVKIVFDLEAAQTLMKVDNGTVPEYEMAKQKAKRRGKRSIPSGNLSKIGIEFPCAVDSLKIFNMMTRKDPSYRLDGPVGNRYIIHTDAVKQLLRQKKDNTSEMTFELNYGFPRCFFDAGEVKMLPNPPPGWLYQRHGIECKICINTRSDEDCNNQGLKKTCEENEICQTEVRQISKNRKLITKSCKQEFACQANSLRKQEHSECQPGKPGSVCRCCCDTDMCNNGDSDDLLICNNKFP